MIQDRYAPLGERAIYPIAILGTLILMAWGMCKGMEGFIAETKANGSSYEEYVKEHGHTKPTVKEFLSNK